MIFGYDTIASVNFFCFAILFSPELNCLSVKEAAEAEAVVLLHVHVLDLSAISITITTLVFNQR